MSIKGSTIKNSKVTHVFELFLELDGADTNLNSRPLTPTFALRLKHLQIRRTDTRIKYSRNRSGPEVIKLFPCSTQLSTKFILLIHVKMPTIDGILTCMSMINTTSERLKARKFFICLYFSF